MMEDLRAVVLNSLPSYEETNLICESPKKGGGRYE